MGYPDQGVADGFDCAATALGMQRVCHCVDKTKVCESSGCSVQGQDPDYTIDRGPYSLLSMYKFFEKDPVLFPPRDSFPFLA
jgi:hypothetical protein